MMRVINGSLYDDQDLSIGSTMGNPNDTPHLEHTYQYPAMAKPPREYKEIRHILTQRGPPGRLVSCGEVQMR